MITRWSEVFSLFSGSPTRLAAVLGTSRSGAFNMMQRGTIPPLWWDALIAYAAREKIPGINYESLGRLAAIAAKSAAATVSQATGE
jgi:hypothetical protein